MKEQKKVLIVDGETQVASTLGHFFESKGCKVTGARNLVEGLHYACQQAFSVVLIDFRVAYLDGLEVLGSLAKAQPKATFAISMKGKSPVPAGDSRGTRFVFANGWVRQLLSDWNPRPSSASPKSSLSDHPTGREFEETVDQFRQAFLRFLNDNGRVSET